MHSLSPAEVRPTTGLNVVKRLRETRNLSPNERLKTLKTNVKPSEHPQLDIIEALWIEGKRATEIVQYLSDNDLDPVNVKSLAKYGQRKWSGSTKLATADTDLDSLKETLAELEDAGLQIGKVALSSREGYVWEKQDGVNVQVKKTTTGRTIEILTDSSPTLERAALPEINVESVKRGEKAKGIGLAISMPDMQIGYFRDHHGNYTTLQDERVLDVTHQIMLDLQRDEGIDTVVMQGDNGDFAEFGKYPIQVGYTGNTQMTIDRIGTEAATVRTILEDNGEIIYLPGNHEARLEKVLVDKVPSLVGISRAGSDQPVLGLDYLCRFDEYNVTYIDGYPTNEFWANEGLQFIHGSTVKSAKGATAAAMLPKGHSVVYGHIHRQELVWGVTASRSGSENIFAGSAGTACKITGEVPSFRGGITSRGGPATKQGLEDWQQGLMVIYYEKDGTKAWPEMVTVHNGETIFRGKRYVSTVDSEGNKI